MAREYSRSSLPITAPSGVDGRIGFRSRLACAACPPPRADIISRRCSSGGQASTRAPISATRPPRASAVRPQSDRLAASTATAPQPDGRIRTTAVSTGELPPVSFLATNGTSPDASDSSVMTSASTNVPKSRPRREQITGPNMAIATVERPRRAPG